MELEIGSTIGGYEVVDILGAGGMGKVYKVRNVISDRIEAMKVLLPDLATMPDLADRFLREIKLQASLDHGNIAQLRTAIHAGNQLLMIMEFVDGETLEHKLRQGPLTVDQAVDYIGQVLCALEFAHARGVVHRDIKPANMMLTPAGIIKLMDFGIAKAAADQKLTMTGTTMGSVYYMSPEQIQGASTLDARADLYSLGVTLYELVTGKRPFDGDSQYSIMAAHLEKTAVPPAALDPRVPQELNDVIVMSVAKDPGSRFQSAAAFRKALMTVKGPLQATTAPVASPPVPAGAAPPSGKRWLWMTLGGVAAAAAIVCAIQLAPWKPTHAAEGPPQTSTVQAQPAAPPAPVVAQTQQPSAPATGGAPAAAIPRETAPVQQASVPKPPEVLQAPPPSQKSDAPQTTAPAALSRALILGAREHLSKLEVRAASIQDSLGNMKSSLQSQGLSLNARFTQPEGLMNAYLESARRALDQSDVALAKSYADKAERQIEILEQLLNL